MLLRQVVSKFKIIRIIKEQLGDYEISSRTDLVLEPFPIYIFPFFAGNMAFRETCNPN